MDERSPRDGAVPVRADGRRSHEQLLAAAQATFAQQGTDASLREIARRAGVSIATLYRHFPTREALLDALLRHTFDTLCALAADLRTTADPGQALAVWIGELAAACTRYDGLPASVLRGLNDPASTLHDSCGALGAAAGDILARAQRSGDIRADLSTAELLATVYAMAWAARQAGRRMDTGDRLLTLLVEGLAARPAPPGTAGPDGEPDTAAGS